MKRYSYLIALLLPSIAFGTPPQTIATGLKNPAAVAVSTDGRIFISYNGGSGKDGDSGIYTIEDGKAKPFAQAMNQPTQMVIFQQWIFVVDGIRIRRVELKTGKVDTWADRDDFPTFVSLQGLAVDETGTST